MALNDEIAQKVMGELHTLTKRIDEQNKQVISSASVIKNAAELIKQNSETAVKNAKETAYQAQLESAAHFEVRMAGSIAKSLTAVADAVATKAAMRWVLAGAVVAGVLTVGAGWVGYSEGKDAGSADGYAKARDEVAAAAWAGTPDGRLAKHFFDLDGKKAALCDSKSWTAKVAKDKTRWCIFGSDGWRIP